MIRAQQTDAIRAALEKAGVDHEVIVYPGADQRLLLRSARDLPEGSRAGCVGGA
jgi:hypothetical protein